MMRLTVTLEAEHLEAIDRLMEGSGGHVPNRRDRRKAIPALLLASARERLQAARLERRLQRLQDSVASVERARDEAAAHATAVQSRLEAARQALREERRRHRVTRGQLNNALHSADRLRTARDRYRELARAIDAALCDPRRASLGDSLESRVRLCLTERGFSLAETPATALDPEAE